MEDTFGRNIRYLRLSVTELLRPSLPLLHGGGGRLQARTRGAVLL